MIDAMRTFKTLADAAQRYRAAQTPPAATIKPKANSNLEGLQQPMASSMLDTFTGQKTPAISQAEAMDRYSRLQGSRELRLARERRTTGRLEDKDRAILEEETTLEKIAYPPERRVDRDYQGNPKSPGGKMGHLQFIPQDLRQIAASGDRFLINQALTEIQFMENSAWYPAYKNPDHVMHGPVIEGKRLMIEALDDLDRK